MGERHSQKHQPVLLLLIWIFLYSHESLRFCWLKWVGVIRRLYTVLSLHAEHGSDLKRCDNPNVNVFLRLDSNEGARRQRWRSLYSPFFVEKWGQISVDFVFLHHGASLCTSAPIEGLHMYHQPCSMTNYICEMRLWGGLPNQSLLSGNVHRFQHVVLYDVCKKKEWCQLGQKWLTCKSHAQTVQHPTPTLCPVVFCFRRLFL